MDDIFDQDADELTTNQNEFNKSMKNVEKVRDLSLKNVRKNCVHLLY